MDTARSAGAAIQESGIAFGTSGARGLVEQFTDEVCAAFTAAFLSVTRERFEFSRVAIAVDRRPSSPRMAAACSAAARSLGYEVDDYGVLPTPALALQSMADGVPAIMVTGSHIPFDRNGLKFYRPDGEIEKADEWAIVRADVTVPAINDGNRHPVSSRAREHYLARYERCFAGKPLAGKRVGLYEHSSAGRELYCELLGTLGAEVISLARSEDFVPIDTEAVSDVDRRRGIAWAAEHRLDALLSTDGDGDRPLLGDEQGRWLRGDIVGLLCARELGIQALAVPVSCNTAIEASGAFEKVVRTRIGSPYVIEAMQTLVGPYERVAGFEANGGFLLGSSITFNGESLAALPTRDALLPALVLLVEAAHKNVALSALVEGLPARCTASDRLERVPVDKSRELLAGWQSDPEALAEALALTSGVAALDATDGLRATLNNGNVVHLRPSGNAPELRCYTEAESEEDASELLKNCLARIDEIVRL